MQNRDRSAIDRTKFVLMSNVSPLCFYNAGKEYFFSEIVHNIASSDLKIKAV